MKLFYNKNSKDPIYYVQKGFRNGNKVTTKNIARIGKHSELLKITPDPLAYAKQQVAIFNDEEKNNNKVSMEVKIDFAQKLMASNDLVSKSTCRNVGYFFLQKLYNDLNIKNFFKNVTMDSRITFDPDLVNRFLSYARILNPDSKLGTYETLQNYYEQPDFDYVHILRTLDVLYEHYDEYISYLFEQSNKIIKRNTAVCYYDCTNYYFEIESPDEDYIDEVTGERIKGLRKYGMAKQHQPLPLVEMGLFMDTDGIPLSMCITSGSDNEQTTAIPLEEKLIKMFKGRKFIYCADAGLGSYHIRNFNAMGGRAFIVTQSVKKLSSVLKDAVFNDCDYRFLSSDEEASLAFMKTFDRHSDENLRLYDDKIYKTLYADKAIDLGLYDEIKLKNGKTRKVKAKGSLKQRVIITYSRKMAEYQKFIRGRQVERARALLANLDPETYKKGPHDVTRFIKRHKKTKNDENITEWYEIDQEAIDEEAKYDGFYAVATNLDDPAADILAVSSKRYKIEDCFRIMKTNFSARPVFHQKTERIIAHFMICYTALLIYRLLETKLDRNGTHFTTENIIETMRNMNVVNVDDMFYLSAYTGSEVCTALNTVIDLGLDKKYYQPKELNKKCKKISK